MKVKLKSPHQYLGGESRGERMYYGERPGQEEPLESHVDRDLNLPQIRTASKLTRLQKERINDTYSENIFEQGELEKEVREEFEKEDREKEGPDQPTSLKEVIS